MSIWESIQAHRKTSFQWCVWIRITSHISNKRRYHSNWRHWLKIWRNPMSKIWLVRREATDRPSTRRPPGNFGFKFNRQTKKAMEAVKGNMSNMPHIGRPPNLHWRRRRRREVTGAGAATNQRFPESSNQKGENRKLISLLSVPFFFFFFSLEIQMGLHHPFLFHCGTVNKGTWVVRPITPTWTTRWTAWRWRQLKHFRHFSFCWLIVSFSSSHRLFLATTIIYNICVYYSIQRFLIHQSKKKAKILMEWSFIQEMGRGVEGETCPSSSLCAPSFSSPLYPTRLQIPLRAMWENLAVFREESQHERERSGWLGCTFFFVILKHG